MCGSKVVIDDARVLNQSTNGELRGLLTDLQKVRH